MTREIPLSRGLVAVIDEADFGLVSQYSWHAMPGRHTFYASRSWWVPAAKRTKSQPMHALLTGWSRVDHIDGDGLNNRRSNLRPASMQENRRNSQSASGSSSKFKGVKRQGKAWVAVIGVRPGVQQYLGYFGSEVAAAQAYDDAARELFGDFARLNLSEASR